MESNYLVQSTTFDGAKDVLMQYGDAYCIIYTMLEQRLGFWLVEIFDIEATIAYNKHMEELEEVERQHKSRQTSAQRKRWHHYAQEFIRHTPHPFMSIPGDVMHQLLQAGVVALSIPDAEWGVQVALGTAPEYRSYVIQKEAA